MATGSTCTRTILARDYHANGLNRCRRRSQHGLKGTIKATPGYRVRGDRMSTVSMRRIGDIDGMASERKHESGLEGMIHEYGTRVDEAIKVWRDPLGDGRYSEILKDPVDRAHENYGGGNELSKKQVTMLRHAFDRLKADVWNKKLAKSVAYAKTDQGFKEISYDEWRVTEEQMHQKLSAALSMPGKTTLHDVRQILRECAVVPRTETFNMLIRRLTMFRHYTAAYIVYSKMKKFRRLETVFTDTSLLTLHVASKNYSGLQKCITSIKRRCRQHKIKKLSECRQHRIEKLSRPVYGAIINAYVKFGKSSLAEAYFKELCRFHRPNQHNLTQMLTLRSLRYDWEGIQELILMLLRDCNKRSVPVDDWSVYHMILACERCGQTGIANAIRDATSGNPLLNHLTTVRPRKRKNAVFLPWTETQRLLAEYPGHPRFRQTIKNLFEDLKESEQPARGGE